MRLYELRVSSVELVNVELRISTLKFEDRFLMGQKESVAPAARDELHLLVSLPGVSLKAKWQLRV